MTDGKHKTGLCKFWVFCCWTIVLFYFAPLGLCSCVLHSRIHTTNTKLHNLPTLTPTPTPTHHTRLFEEDRLNEPR